MKKVVLIVLSCVFILGCFACFSACGDDDLSKDPIIGTWFCKDSTDNSVYYIEITEKDRQDKNAKYALNWNLYKIFDWSDEMFEKSSDLRVNSEEKGKYTVFCDFKTVNNIRENYQVEMNGNDSFIVTGKYTEIYEKDLRLEFTRTALTVEQFEAQYLNK